jgi:integrase
VSVKRRADTAKWEVRWRDGGRNRSKSFTRKADADRFETEVDRRKQLGGLAELTAGEQALVDLVEQWWRTHALPHLARNTRNTYATVWAKHALPRLGGMRVRDITPRVIDQFQTDLRAAGVGEPTISKTLTMLQAVFKRAVVWGAVGSNPVSAIKKPSQRASRAVVLVPPVRVELMRASLLDRGRFSDAALVCLQAYAGLRPGEILGMRWRHVRDRTLHVEGAVALGEEKATKTGMTRTVPLLSPLAQDLAAYRMASGRPDDDQLLFPAASGGVWQDHDWRNWRRRVYQPLAKEADIQSSRPYDLRHSFVSLLIYEGLNVIEVARRAGHSPQMCLNTYAHLFAEFDPAARKPAEDVISGARDAAGVRETYAAVTVSG